MVIQGNAHRDGAKQKNLLQRNSHIGELPKAKAVQCVFDRRPQGFLTDGSIKAAAAASRKPPCPGAVGDKSQINPLKIGGMQDVVKSRLRRRGQPQASGKIIAGSRGNIAEGNS